MIFIKTLRLKNFKSIEDQFIRLNSGLNIIVGPNNAGKTTVIEAIDLLLGDVYLPNFEPSTDHFYNGDDRKEILVEAVLGSDTDELCDILSSSEKQIEVRFKYSKINGGCFEVKNNCVWEQKYNKPFGYYWDFDKKLFFLRVRSLRNIMEIAPIRWKSPLKYFKEIILKRTPRERLEKVLEEINKSKDKLSEIDEVKSLISDLLTISKDQTEIKKISLSPSSTSYSDILNEMKILIDDGYLSEVNKKGMGTQNLTIISLFRVMAKYIREDESKSIIYGIDEPEIGLHPHAQRHLLKSLEKLAEIFQVIITTHSSNLVNIYNVENIIRVDRNGGKTIAYQTTLSNHQKKILEIQGDEFKEIFFCKRALIVEGKTEAGFFPQASKKIINDPSRSEQVNENSYSFDISSVTVVNGEGNTIWHFVKLIRALSIPYVLLIDSDKEESVLENSKKSGAITEAEYNALLSEDSNHRRVKLENFNIYIHEIFETALCSSATEQTLRKIIESINFVKKNWGYLTEINNYEHVTELNELKMNVKQYMINNKKRKIGHVIAQALEQNEYPNEYIKIIKQVSNL